MECSSCVTLTSDMDPDFPGCCHPSPGSLLPACLLDLTIVCFV